MEMGDYADAEETFQGVAARFGDNPLAGNALFLAGYARGHSSRIVPGPTRSFASWSRLTPTTT